MKILLLYWLTFVALVVQTQELKKMPIKEVQPPKVPIVPDKRPIVIRPTKPTKPAPQVIKTPAVVNRILAHITTDKPIYKANDVAFVEVFLIDPTTKKPAKLLNESWDYRENKMISREQKVLADMKILDMFGNQIYAMRGVWAKDGTVVFTYKVPKGVSGGEYQIKVESF